jgi:hypothetical protein
VARAGSGAASVIAAVTRERGQGEQLRGGAQVAQDEPAEEQHEPGLSAERPGSLGSGNAAAQVVGTGLRPGGRRRR